MKPQRLILCLLTGVLAGLAGCAVGPDYHPPRPGPEAPAGFDAGLGAGVPAPATQPAEQQLWWTALADPELDSLVGRAMQANFDLAIALTRLNEARSFRYVVAADLWPTLSVSGAAARSSGNNATRGRVDSPLNAASDTTRGVKEITQATGFDASWELDFFGHVSRAVEAADADSQVAAEARNQARLIVIADVVRAYVHLRGTQLRLAIARQTVAAEQRTLDLVRRRLALFLTNELDVALAERQVETAQATVPPLIAEIAATQRQIAVLLGGDPQALYDELGRTVPLAQPPTRVPLDHPSDLLRHRPDVRQAERQLAAETARIGVAVATLFPRVTLSGALGVQAEGRPFFGWDQRYIYSGGPGVSWPILDFGRLEAAKQVQDWRTQRALLTYRETVQLAVKDVDDSLGQFASEQDRFQRLQAAVRASERATELATARYDQGLADFLNVLDAQRQLYALQDQAAASQESALVDWAALNKALGRGWEITMPGGEAPSPKPGISAPVELITSRAGTALPAGE
jgi:NodT family efflux transporter outer membrane factor (OMF) lipoprotein